MLTHANSTLSFTFFLRSEASCHHRKLISAVIWGSHTQSRLVRISRGQERLFAWGQEINLCRSLFRSFTDAKNVSNEDTGMLQYVIKSCIIRYILQAMPHSRSSIWSIEDARSFACSGHSFRHEQMLIFDLFAVWFTGFFCFHLRTFNLSFFWDMRLVRPREALGEEKIWRGHDLSLMQKKEAGFSSLSLFVNSVSIVSLLNVTLSFSGE